MGAAAGLSCVYVQRGSEKKKSSRARPPHPVCPPLPPWLRWPAPLCASQGRFLSQLGVLGCVAACLYWSVDFLVAACTYLNIPPGHCSVFPASHSLPPPPPFPPSSRLISNRLLCLTPSFLLYHSFNPLSNLLLDVPSLPRAPSFFSSLDWGFSHGSSCTFTPRLRPHADERKSRTVWSKKEAFQAHSQEITQCKTMATQLGLVGLNEK